MTCLWLWIQSTKLQITLQLIRDLLRVFLTQDLQLQSLHSLTLWLSSLEVSLHLQLSIASVSLHAYRYAAFTYQYWQFFHRQWSGISDVSIDVEETAVDYVSVKKIPVVAVVVNFCLQNKLNSLDFMMNQKKIKTTTMTVIDRVTWCHYKSILMLKLIQWTQIVVLLSDHKEEEAQSYKGAWHPEDLSQKTSIHLVLKNS